MSIDRLQYTPEEFLQHVGLQIVEEKIDYNDYAPLDKLLQMGIENLPKKAWESRTCQPSVTTLWRDGYETEPIAAMHMYRVASLVEIFATIAHQVQPYLITSQEHIAVITDAALLHDIGKTQPQIAAQLSKIFPTGEDIAQLKFARFIHPIVSAEMIKQAGLNSLIQEIALKHHEKPDGSGFPASLINEDIPLEVTLIKICDTIDSGSADKPWKHPKYRSPLEALENILQGCDETINPVFYPSLLIFFKWASRPEAQDLLNALMSRTHYNGFTYRSNVD